MKFTSAHYEQASRLTPDNELNRASYGVAAREILTGTTTIAPPTGVRVFLDALRRPKS